MGILTTQDSAKGFSSYVALFGFALLIASAIYLKRLDNWAELNQCVLDNSIATEPNIILCSNFGTWRTAAIIGIIIGVVDVLIVPFLICCTVCVVCGCTALFCACVDCESLKSTENETTTTTTTATTLYTTILINESSPNHENETTTVTNSGVEDKDPVIDKLNKFNLKNLPEPAATILNLLGWTFWVFLPLIGTLLITVWLCETDAIRTQNDKLYASALAVFVCALLNLMVYWQKFIDSVLKFVCQKVCGAKSLTESKKDEEAEGTSKV